MKLPAASGGVFKIKIKTGADSLEFARLLGHKVVLFGPLSRSDPK